MLFRSTEKEVEKIKTLVNSKAFSIVKEYIQKFDSYIDQYILRIIIGNWFLKLKKKLDKIDAIFIVLEFAI